MTNTSYPVDSELPGELRGYGLNPESEQFEDKTILNPAPPGGAGAMISDISDLGVYARALYDGDLLTPQTHQERLEAQQLGPNCCVVSGNDINNRGLLLET